MKTIELTNFLKMTPEVPQFSQKNQHYLIAGANPTYYLDVGGQEEQIAPLTASLAWVKFGILDNQSIAIDGNIVCLIAGTNTTYSAYFITDTTHVYGITPAFAVINLGYPSNASVANQNGARIQISGNEIFATYTSSNLVYYHTLTSFTVPTGAWSTLGGGANVGIAWNYHIMEPFQDWMAYSDSANGGNGVPFSFVDKLDYATNTLYQYPAVNTLSLGAGSNILGMKNYNNKYIAIATTMPSLNSANDYINDYLRLWDGVSSTTNYSIKIPGKYIDMIVIECILYMAVKVSSTKTKLYMLYNNVLREVFTQQYSTISDSTPESSALENSLFNFYNSVGLKLDATTDIPTHPFLMIYGKQDIGTSEFILSSGYDFNQFCLGNDGVLYSSFSVALSGGQTLAYYPKVAANSNYYNTILYKSQWIPVENLQAIDIYYDTPPKTSGDYIDVTIDGEGEDYQNSTTQPVTTHLLPTSETHTITYLTYLNKKRTRRDVQGFTGSSIRITLSTTQSSDWRPIIRGIVLITK